MRISNPDKLYLTALAGVVISLGLISGQMDAVAFEPAGMAEESQQEAIFAPVLNAPLLEAVEEAREDWYDESIPLDLECQKALREACAAHHVPPCDILGIIEVESGFRSDAENGISYGLCQLNRKYFPDGLSPAENIRAGVEYYGMLLERYKGDTQAALTAYNAGYDTGSRTYARAILNASDKWGYG